MQNKTFSISLIILMLITLPVAYASAPKVGTAACPELLIPVGARNVALGGGNIADIKGVDAIYWNPAGLAMLKGGEASFNYMKYFAGMKVSNMGAGVRIGQSGAFGVTLQVLDIGDIPVTTIEAPEGTGEMIAPIYLTLGATYSRRFTDRINFGTNMKIISEKIGNMSASAVAFDFGLQYVSPWNISFGVAMRNLGSSVKFDGTGIEFDSEIPWANPNAVTRKTRLDLATAQLPANMTMGLSYTYKLGELHQVNFVGNYINNSFTIDQMCMGAEYGFKNMLFLRGGYTMTLFPDDYTETAKDDNQFGLAYGFGWHLPLGGSNLLFDYAYRPMKNFDANQYFSIGVSF